MNAPLPNDLVAVLKRARAYIRKGWTQGPFAVSKSGRSVNASSKYACKWCLSGALWRAVDESKSVNGSLYSDAYEAIAQVVPRGTPVMFNEAYGRTKKEVLAKFDEAIARLS